MNKNLLRWMIDAGCSDIIITEPDDNNHTKTITTLQQLEAAVRNFDGCRLRETAQNTVFADGTTKSGLMIIGEAPGATEDQQGIPFCGQSGKLLDQILQAIGLARNEVYITNVVFWRPEGNRRPNEEEIESCMPFVKQHIALIKPKLLLLLGSTATIALLNADTNITNMRGKVFYYTNEFLTDQIPTFVSYHPSYLLRRPLSKREAWYDFLKVKTFLKKL